MKDFKDKVAVITGGASGVGRALGDALAAEGAKIVLADVDEKGLETAVAALNSRGTPAIGVRTDVSRQEDLDNLADKAFAEFGAVHLMFANAGIGAGEAGDMWDYNLNDWKWAFSVNIWGVIHSINAFMPRLVEQNEEAHFVVTGSGNGAFLMLPDAPIYTTTKASVMAITETLYYQMLAKQSPVKVNALFPGPHVVDTGLFNSERVRPEDLPGSGVKASGISSVDDMKKMMEQFGMELETTSPQEVAAYAVQALKEDKFWIRPSTEKSDNALRDRIEGIISQTNPVPPNVL